MNDDLTALLHDAVEDVEPAERLPEIRRRTREHRTGRWRAAGGAALLAAAAAAVVAVVVPRSLGPDTDIGDRAREGRAVAVYYPGRTPDSGLYREFHRLPGDPDLDAVLDQLSRAPDDPDYETLWQPGQLLEARVADRSIFVTVDPAVVTVDPTPGSEAAVQQVVYTLQAEVRARLPVRFRADGEPVAEVLGVATPGPVRARDDALAPVSISNPSEDREVVDRFSANGVTPYSSGPVSWRLLDADGTPRLTGVTTSAESASGGSAPWQTGEIDVSDLPSGSYTFEASLPGLASDTRSIRLR